MNSASFVPEKKYRTGNLKVILKKDKIVILKFWEVKVQKGRMQEVKFEMEFCIPRPICSYSCCVVLSHFI